MTDYQITNSIVKQIQVQFKAGNGLNSANMRLLLDEFVRLEIAYLCLQTQIRNSQTSVVADTVERLQADNARLAEQVGKLVAELERAQAGEKTQ